MVDNDRHESIDGSDLETDGAGIATGVQTRQQTRYLDNEVNILRPSTPFMRDHLRLIWTGFAAWALLVFGPVTLTAVAPDVMTAPMPILEFPLHYFLMAIGAPTGGLLLSYWYVRKRDELDEKYGVDHVATDGGVDE